LYVVSLVEDKQGEALPEVPQRCGPRPLNCLGELLAHRPKSLINVGASPDRHPSQGGPKIPQINLREPTQKRERDWVILQDLATAALPFLRPVCRMGIEKPPGAFAGEALVIQQAGGPTGKSVSLGCQAALESKG